MSYPTLTSRQNGVLRHRAAYEDQIEKCEAITQARIDELAALRKKSELEAQEAAHSLSCVRTELSDYKCDFPPQPVFPNQITALRCAIV